jgi:hypothetical protein
MATTTNYGWDTPDDTDLVKDGAAAIRTLGSSIDTTTKNLNPETTLGDLAYRSATANVKTRLALGTAGQVLRVNSGGNAPEWATTADQTPLTTKGDLFGFDTADARIPIGTNGHILTADSTQSLGLKWAAPAGGGKIAQVIFASTAAGTDIASITFTDTGLSATITPSAASSRIIIYAGQEWVAEAGASAIKSYARLMRGATEIINYGVVHHFDFPNTSGTRKSGSIKPLFYVDSPSTTSSTTYKVQGRINTTDDARIIRCQYETYSTIILMEVLA